MAKKDLPAGVVNSLDALAAALGFHRRTLSEWTHRDGFPRRQDNTYHIVQIERWRVGHRFIEDNPQEAACLLDDMDTRCKHLLEQLKEMQPKLAESLPEDQRAAFSALLDETIGGAVKDSFDGDCEWFYRDYYKGEPQ